MPHWYIHILIKLKSSCLGKKILIKCKQIKTTCGALNQPACAD